MYLKIFLFHTKKEILRLLNYFLNINLCMYFKIVLEIIINGC